MKAQDKKAGQITKGLIEYLKKTGQMAILPKLVKEALKKSNIQKDPSKAIVTTAIALDQAELDEIAKIISALAKRDISASNQVDPEVIGGLKIEVGDKLIDNTIRLQLQNLGERLSQ